MCLTEARQVHIVDSHDQHANCWRVRKK